MSTTGRWDELFATRRWRVAEEVSGPVTVPGQGSAVITIRFTRGEFEITPPGAFASPLSTNLGRRGTLLAETDESGERDLGTRIAVGRQAVIKAREQYGTIW
jgi:hypothetical protein